MNKPEKLIRDYGKWRCGDDNGNNILGEGETMLLNDEGYSCCLGQFSKQLGASDSHLRNCYYPCDMGFKIPLFIDDKILWMGNDLSHDCVRINDDNSTTPEEKIILLTDRLKQEGIQLEVINKP